MARLRRPSAYQARPAMLPPGTHFRQAVETVPPTEDGEPDAAPIATEPEPGEVPEAGNTAVEEPVEETAEAPPTADDAEGSVVTEPPGTPEPEARTRKRSQKRSRKREPEPEPEPVEVVAVQDETVAPPAADEPDVMEHQEPGRGAGRGAGRGGRRSISGRG